MANVVVNRPLSVVEGLDASAALSLTFQNVSTLSTQITVSFDAAGSTVTNGTDVSVGSFSGSISRSQSPAGNYTYDLPSISIFDDLVAEGTETISIRIRATGQVFDNGTDTTIVTISLLDNEIDGTNGNDVLTGYRSADTLRGFDGDDVLTGGLGNDRIDGGAGFDTAVFSQTLAGSQVSYGQRALMITGADGTDTLTGIEVLKFSDGQVVLGGNALVDALFYNQKNADVYATGMQASAHYTIYGTHEGRDPNAFFSVRGYQAANRDVVDAYYEPLAHYQRFGWHEGRDPSAAFDTTLYLLNNKDVADAGINPLEHYLNFGRYEGRAVYAAVGKTIMANGFDREYYLLANPDVAAAGTDAWRHYQLYGAKEGRDPNAWFDTSAYLDTNKDVAAAGLNPLDHYHDYGWREGRDPSAAFDTRKYLAANPDIAGSGLDPFVHFLQYGIYEGRSPQGDGNLSGPRAIADAFNYADAGADAVPDIAFARVDWGHNVEHGIQMIA
jgi:serralysin